MVAQALEKASYFPVCPVMSLSALSERLATPVFLYESCQ